MTASVNGPIGIFEPMGTRGLIGWVMPLRLVFPFGHHTAVGVSQCRLPQTGLSAPCGAIQGSALQSRS